MNRGRLAVVWAFAAEVILAGLIYVFVIRISTPELRKAFLCENRGYLLAVMGGLLAFSGAMYALFMKLVATDFGDYLFSVGADKVFRSAFAWPITVFVSSLVMVIFCGQLSHVATVHVMSLLLIYAVINLITLVKNVSTLSSLNHHFRSNAKEAEREMEKPGVR